MDRDIAIVIPTYNSASTIGACIQSILDQTLAPAEVVVVDDSDTTDTTRDICDRLGARIIVSSAKRALSRNEGFASTSSELLLSIDSDMRLSPTLVECLSNSFAEGTDAITIKEVTSGPGLWCRGRRIDKAAVEETRKGIALRAFTRTIFERVGGFDATLTAGEDLDLHMRIIALGARVKHIDEAYIEHDEDGRGLLDAIRRKYFYGRTMPDFERKHDVSTLSSGWGSRILSGVRISLRDDPVALAPFLILKTGEAIAGLIGREVGRRRSAKDDIAEVG